jgi:hypothetical protein
MASWPFGRGAWPVVRSVAIVVGLVLLILLILRFARC